MFLGDLLLLVRGDLLARNDRRVLAALREDDDMEFLLMDMALESSSCSSAAKIRGVSLSLGVNDIMVCDGRTEWIL